MIPEITTSIYKYLNFARGRDKTRPHLMSFNVSEDCIWTTDGHRVHAIGVQPVCEKTRRYLATSANMLRERVRNGAETYGVWVPPYKAYLDALPPISLCRELRVQGDLGIKIAALVGVVDQIDVTTCDEGVFLGAEVPVFGHQSVHVGDPEPAWSTPQTVILNPKYFDQGCTSDGSVFLPEDPLASVRITGMLGGYDTMSTIAPMRRAADAPR